MEQCQGKVELARCIIVLECAPLLSTVLAGEQDRGQALVEKARSGLKHLDSAGEIMEGLSKDDTQAGFDEMRARIELLRSFAEVFMALGELDESQASRDRLVDACGALSAYFDDNDKAIAESAKLWQGVAYRRAGKSERALQVLRPAVATPASGRIGLFARFERCRALADRGEYAAAIALVMRLQTRVDTWLDGEDEATRKQAADSVANLAAELYRQWARKLRETGNPDRADEALTSAKKMAHAADADRLTLIESIAGASEGPIAIGATSQESEP